MCSKTFLVHVERDGQTRLVAVTVSGVAPKDLPKLSRRMARKLVKGEKLSKLLIQPLFSDDDE